MHSIASCSKGYVYLNATFKKYLSYTMAAILLVKNLESWEIHQLAKCQPWLSYDHRCLHTILCKFHVRFVQHNWQISYFWWVIHHSGETTFNFLYTCNTMKVLSVSQGKKVEWTFGSSKGVQITGPSIKFTGHSQRRCSDSYWSIGPVMNILLLDQTNFYWTLPHVWQTLGMTGDTPVKI